jgi:hypothetical protein
LRSPAAARERTGGGSHQGTGQNVQAIVTESRRTVARIRLPIGIPGAIVSAENDKYRHPAHVQINPRGSAITCMSPQPRR